MIIESAFGLMAAIDKWPRAYCHKHRTGGFFMYLLKKYGEDKMPKDLVCNKTLKVMHKGVKLYDTLFEYPFDLEEFERKYLSYTK